MILRLLAFTSVALLAFTSPSFAAKGAKKGQKGAGKPGRVLARFDRDHNGVIEGQEATRLQAAYTHLAEIDTDKNGQLSDTEIAAVKVPIGKNKVPIGKKRGKKAGAFTPGAATSTPAPKAPPAATPAPATTPAKVE